eukprot:TRINITY_DN9691_c0_g1_i1.p1 TRINITY_DN9691_c0_g1~~TRINITY_DN9691_c0_g1_i1.p1  ORF type:complete len:134 (+),score=25.13 TRINITY_DN9691_c0_g1_i1:3-404(+)
MESIMYCEDLVLDGYDDWRLPNNKEMNSFMDESRAGPAYNISVFPHDKDSNNWWWCSNNNVAFGNNYWWGWSGGDGTSYVNVSPGLARCVRGPTDTWNSNPNSPQQPSESSRLEVSLISIVLLVVIYLGAQVI